MSDKEKKARWIVPLGIYLSLNLIMILFDSSSWSLNFLEGSFIKRLMHAKFFTEWFNPYSTSEFNVLTVLFAIIFLPEILINALEYIKARRQASTD